MNNISSTMAMGFLIFALATSACFASPTFPAASSNAAPFPYAATPSAPPPTNSTPVEEQCANAVNNATDPDKNCYACVKAAQGQCFFCYTDNKCRAFFTTNIFHTPEECEYTQARIWTCEINLQVMAITLMSIFGVILVLILCCCCYCCCCKRSEGTTRWKKELRRLEEDRKRRKEQAEERKKEREARYEEIRRKYGLNDSKPGYKRMS